MAIPSVLALIYLQTTLAQQSSADDDGCFSLANSKTCPAFQAFYVGLPGLAARYAFLTNITDITSFDAALNANVLSANNYLFLLQCVDSDDSFTVPYARYSLSRLCATLIQDSDYSLPCNWKNNVNPLPLCKSTCLQWTDSVDSLTNNTSTCPNQQQREEDLQNILISSCNTWQGFNATTNCILGQQNEPNNCGFGDDMARACQYCKSANDDCCSAMGTCGLSKGAIIGIIIGCIVAVALIGYAIFFYCCYRKKRVRNENFSFKTYIPSPSSEHNGSDFISTNSRQPLANEPPSRWSSERYAYGEDEEHTETLQPEERISEVIHPYPQQNGDELQLNKGDIVYMLLRFDDGWALGYNLTTDIKGVFPLVCVAPASKELLEQLSLEEEDEGIAGTIALGGRSCDVGTHDKAQYFQRLRDDIRRSRSLNSIPLNANGSQQPSPDASANERLIPRRTASTLIHHHDCEDPTITDSQDSYEMSRRQRMSKYQLPY